MRVISRGVPERDKKYLTTCNNCNSQLEFTKQEAEVVMDRNETCFVIKCAVCDKKIWISHNAMIQAPPRNL